MFRTLQNNLCRFAGRLKHKYNHLLCNILTSLWMAFFREWISNRIFFVLLPIFSKSNLCLSEVKLINWFIWEEKELAGKVLKVVQ
jgi:hypothetical protein